MTSINQQTSQKKMKKNKIPKIICATTLMLAGLTALISLAESNTECNLATVTTGTNSCAGKYYAVAKMTNSSGSIWIKPPTNIVVTTGTLTDMSGFPAPYSSCAAVQKLGSTTFTCGSNTVTFPATNSASYQLIVFVTSPTPPPTNGQPMTLQVDWQ